MWLFSPDHYVVINLRQDGKVIGTKETKGASGSNPIWNAPFLFDLPPGDISQLPLVFEFIVMQVGRLASTYIQIHTLMTCLSVIFSWISSYLWNLSSVICMSTQGRLYTKSTTLGRVLIGSSASEAGQGHWTEMCSRGQIETARWHSIQSDVSLEWRTDCGTDALSFCRPLSVPEVMFMMGLHVIGMDMIFWVFLLLGLIFGLKLFFVLYQQIMFTK